MVLNRLVCLSLFCLICLPPLALAQISDSNEHYEKALVTFEAQDYEATYIHLKNSIKERPDNLPAKILMGKVLLNTGYLFESEETLWEALNQGGDPNLIADTLAKVLLLQGKNNDVLDLRFPALVKDQELNLLLLKATAYLNLANTEKAQQIYLQAKAINPEDTRVLNALTSSYLLAGDIASASEHIEKSMLIDDRNTVTWRLVGDVFAAENNYPKAIESFLMGLSITTKDPLILRNLARAYLKNNQLVEAENTVDRILEESPDDPMAILIKSWLLMKSSNESDAMLTLESLSLKLSAIPPEVTSSSPDLLFLDGLSNYALGNLEAARRLLTKYVDTGSINTEAVSFLVDVHRKLGENEQAVDLLEKFPDQVSSNLSFATLAVDLYLNTKRTHRAIFLLDGLEQKFPGHPAVIQMRAKVLASRGKFDSAIDELNKYEQFKDMPSFTLTRASLFMQENRYDDALQETQSLLNAAPSNPNFLNFHGAILLQLKRTSDAKRTIEKALELAPEHFAAKFNLARLLYNSGQLSEAEKIVTELLSARPMHSQSILLLASIEQSRGQIENAIARVEELVLNNGNDTAARSRLIDLLTQTSEYDRALGQLQSLSKIKSIDDSQISQKAQIYTLQNNIQGARKELNKLFALWLSEPSKLYQLADRQAQVGDIKGAIRSIEKALELAPQSQQLRLERIRLAINDNDIKDATALLQNLGDEFNKANIELLSGDIAKAEKEFEIAGRHYKEALTIAPNFTQALIKWYQLTRDNFSKANFAQTIEEILEKASDLHFHRNILADFYLNNGELDKARSHYQVLEQVDGYQNRHGVLNNLANLLVVSGEVDGAFKLAEEAYSLAQTAAVTDTYGWTLALLNRYEEALPIMRDAYAQNSNDPSVLYHLAYVLNKLNRPEDARRELAKSLAMQTDFLERGAAEDLMQQL